MENAWPTVPIGELFRLKQGTYLTPAEMATEKADAFPFPVYGANGVIGYSNRKMYSARTTLVSCRGANCGVVHYTVPDVWISNNSIACVPITEIDPTFYYYVCLNTDFGDVITGSAQPQITITNLSSKQFIKPPLPIQRRIAGILSAYDELIENSQRRIKILEEMARALYREWFVEFRFPGHESVPLVPSPLGEIPQGWEVRKLGDICTRMESGGTPRRSTAEYWDDGEIDWYKTGELWDGFLFEAQEKITALGQGESTARLFEPGTILMAIYGSPTVGRMGILTTHASCNQAALGLVADKRVISQTYLYFILYSLRDHFNGLAQGAAQQNISKEKVSGAMAVVPSRQVLDSFDSQAVPLFEQVRTLQQQIQNLRRTRDLLLPRLLSGETALEA